MTANTTTLIPPAEGHNMWSSEPSSGLWQKYNVIDRFSGDMVNEPTFTIKVNSDPHAEAALLAYARSVQNENPQLAREIMDYFQVV
jgi:hypothetical protein